MWGDRGFQSRRSYQRLGSGSTGHSQPQCHEACLSLQYQETLVSNNLAILHNQFCTWQIKNGARTAAMARWGFPGESLRVMKVALCRHRQLQV